MSILTTASTPVPIKIPVNTRLSGIITSVISTEPTASPAAMPFLPPIFLYIRPDARTSTPDAQKCMRKPIMWLDELTVSAWIAEVMSRITSPADGPNSIVPMSTGTSAMSYSRNGAEGKSGNLMKYTDTTATAASIAMTVILRRFCLEFFFMSIFLSLFCNREDEKAKAPPYKRGANAFFASSSIRTLPSAPESHRINRSRGSRASAFAFTAGGEFHPAPEIAVYIVAL